MTAQPVFGGDPTARRVGRPAAPAAPASRGARPSASRGQNAVPRPYQRPTLELPGDVICGAIEPPGGVDEIAAAVRLCLVGAGGPAEAAFASIAQARGTAAAIRLARAYVDIRAANAAA